MRLPAIRTQRYALLAAVGGLVLVTCTAPLAVKSLTDRMGNGEQLVRTEQVDAPSSMLSVSEPVAPPALPTQPPVQPAGPTDVDASAVDPAAAEAQFDPVAVQQPKLRVDEVEASRDVVAELLEVDGVTFATTVSLGELVVHGPEEARRVRVAAVDPAGFRVLTPQVTADAVEVWHRITEGDAAFIHDAAHQLKLELGGRVPVGDGSDTLRVGAFASNGIPPVAEAVVDRGTAESLGVEGSRSVLIAVDPGASAEQVADRVAAVVGSRPTVLDDPAPQRAFLTGSSAAQAFEPFTYIDHGDGMITIDSDWVRRNIVSAQVPVFRGHVVCHRLLIPQLRGALQEIVDLGLDHLIDPTQYGGCWVPRHIDFNPGKPLSMHAWGLAVDFNVSTNQLGQPPQMDPRIVDVFDRWGFVWGGRWSRPDGMHFELGAVLQSPGG
jgi:hypothetical protein